MLLTPIWETSFFTLPPSYAFSKVLVGSFYEGRLNDRNMNVVKSETKKVNSVTEISLQKWEDCRRSFCLQEAPCGIQMVIPRSEIELFNSLLANRLGPFASTKRTLIIILNSCHKTYFSNSNRDTSTFDEHKVGQNDGRHQRCIFTQQQKMLFERPLQLV